MSQSVLITGASTGIGFSCAVDLDKRGCKVFAGVRKETDAKKLRESGSNCIKPIIIDVTDTNSIMKAVSIVGNTLSGAGLDALINNAGIAIVGPLECLSMRQMKRQFDINFFGQIVTTQAFLPLIRKAKGRIVNISSLGGRSSSPLFGIYSASKFALEAVSDTWRVELRPWGIKVVLIEPGAVQTPLWEKTRTNVINNSHDPGESAKDLYGSVIDYTKHLLENLENKAIPAQAVTEKVYRALMANRPRARYLIGPEAHQRVWIERLPTRIRDRIIGGMFGIER
jgi:NAD(P)-dependent dehydrogenase (short-subunit alcohol dehydrogenase family)